MVTNKNYSRLAYYSILIIGCLATFYVPRACGQSGALEKWIRYWESGRAKNEGDGRAVRRILFLKKIGGDGMPKLVQLDSVKFKPLGYITTMDSSDLRLAYQLNTRRLADSKDSSDPLKNVFLASGVDTIALPSGGQWQFYQLENGKPVVVREVPAVDLKTEEQVQSWLSKQMGFNAVALMQKGKYVLVLAPQTLPKKGRQALALSPESDPLLFLDTKKGQALMQLVAASGNYGMFKVVTSGKKKKAAISYGTKVLVQQK